MSRRKRKGGEDKEAVEGRGEVVEEGVGVGEGVNFEWSCVSWNDLNVGFKVIS